MLFDPPMYPNTSRLPTCSRSGFEQLFCHELSVDLLEMHPSVLPRCFELKHRGIWSVFLLGQQLEIVLAS